MKVLPVRPLCSVTAGHRSTARQSGASGAAGADTLDGDLAPPSRGPGTSNYLPLHSGKIRHLTWTFPKRYLRCPSTAQYSPVQPSTAQYFLVNVQVKWLILPLCTVPIVRCLLSQACLAPSSKLKNHGNFFI